MRSDLPSSLSTALSSLSRSPRQLMVFRFPTAGNVTVSDQLIGSGEGFGNEWIPLVESWGELVDIASGDPKDHLSGEVRKMSVVLWNGEIEVDGETRPPFSDYFLSEDIENVVVDLYQWDASISGGGSNTVLIDRLVVQDPVMFDEKTNRITMDLVSLSMRYDAPIGDVVTLEDWPSADKSFVGYPIDLVVGDAGEIPLIPAKTSATATLESSILETDLSITANEDLDLLAFPTTGGTIQIDEEKIIYSSHNGGTFVVSQRGAEGTTAAEHISTHDIIEHITDHTYLIGRGPVQDITDVKVDGYPNQAAFTKDLESNPARIVFSEVPYSVRFAAAPSFKSLQFDEILAQSTALQGHAAILPEDGEAATINETYPLLAIEQKDINEDVGEITKCYLGVEYFSGPNAFQNDSVQIRLNGAVLGTLPRPNTQGAIELAADVDIDHGHNHSISGEHVHDFTDPALAISDPSHLHTLDSVAGTEVFATGGTIGISDTFDGGFPASDKVAVAGFTIDLSEYVPGGAKYGEDPLQYVVINTDVTNFCQSGQVSLSLRKSTYPTWERAFENYGESTPTAEGVNTLTWQWFGSAVRATIEQYPDSVPSGDYQLYLNFSALDLWCYNTTHTTLFANTSGFVYGGNQGVNPSGSNVSVTTNAPGENAISTDKATDDVESLATDNVAVNVTAAEPTTQSFVKLFDITDVVSFDWSTFTNAKVAAEYFGDLDDENVYILNIFLDVEYRKKELGFGGKVTATVSGAIDDGLGTATGTPGSLIQNPIHLVRYLMTTIGGMDSSVHDSSGSQATAISALNSLGYQFDGVLAGDLSIRDAVKRCSRQSRTRLWWNGGLLKAALRQNISGLSPVRDLDPDDYRIKSMSAERQSVRDLQNVIRLAYDKDHVTDEDGLPGYEKISTGQSTASIEANGIRQKAESFLFELVRDDDMAADLLSFYTENLASASTFYTFESYLTNFELEKEDCISLTTAVNGFGQLKKARAVIRSIDRIFGSGKNKQINVLRMVAEVVRYIRLTKSLSDTVTGQDVIAVIVGFLLEFADQVSPASEESFAIGAALTDLQGVASALDIVTTWSSTESESVTPSYTEAVDMVVNPNGVFYRRFGGGLIPGYDWVNIKDDSLFIEILSGYGAGGYGLDRYGGYGDLVEWISDIINIQDDSLVTATGEALADTATATEDIYFSWNGFGSGVGSSGFGSSSFGD